MYLRTGKWLAFGVLGLVLSAAEGVLADSPDAVSGDETVCLTRLFAPRGVYFNTGFYPDQNSCARVTIDVQKTVEYWFGAWNSDWNREAFALGNDGGGVYAECGSSGTGTDQSPVSAGRHTMELDAGVYRLDGVVKRTISGYTFKLRYPLYLFAQNRKGSMYQRSEQGTIIFYSMQLFDNGTRVKDLRPARRSDGTIGLCDLDNGRAFIAKSGSSEPTWDGIAYTTRGSTLCIHDGRLESTMLDGYAAAEKVGGNRLDACSVTQYVMPLTLAAGTLSVQDGVATARTVDGALTLKGGARVALDVTPTGCDNFTATTIQLVDASAENPIVLEMTSVGLTRLAANDVFPIFAGGLSDGDAAKFRLEADFPALLEVRAGQLVITAQSISPSVPYVAHWTNARGDGDLAQPGNWACTNAFGEAITAVPTDATTVYLPNDRVFSCTNGAPFACHDVVLPTSLAGDSDWRGLGAQAAITGTLNLKGHKLYLSALTGGGAIIDGPDYELLESVHAPKGAVLPQPEVSGGEVHLDVPAGAVLENRTVLLKGTVKVVKEGAGDLMMSVPNQSYSSGTDVRAGRLLLGANLDSTTSLGAAHAPIQIDAGAVLEINGKTGLDLYSVVLNGGTLQNSVAAAAGVTVDRLSALTVTAPSAVNVVGETPFTMGARVVVALAADSVDPETPVLAWTHEPSNRTNLVCAATAGALYSAEARTDGIYVSPLDAAWCGGEAGDWNDAANWVDGKLPSPGDTVQISGTVLLTYDGAEAEVSDLLVRLNEQGGIELLAGTVRPGVKLKVNRVRVGTPLTVEPKSFFGLTPTVQVQWSRAATASQKDYVAVSTEMSWTPQTDDYEHWVKAVVSDARGVVLEKEFFVSTLPVFYLTTDDGQTPTQNKEKHDGWLFVQGNDEWHGEQVWFNVNAPQNASSTFLLPTQLKGAEGMVTSTRVHDWCVSFLQHYGNAVTAVDGYDAGESYAEICDVESLVSYFLVLEMFGNDDGRYRSVYAYKDIDGPFKYGPVWDFDFGVGNYQMAYNPEAWLANYHRANAFKEWADDPWFCTLLWTRYPAARAAFEEIVKDGGLIDQYYEQLRIPAEVNERKWRHHYGYQGGIYGTGSHPGLKAFFKTRLAWMDRQFTDVPTLMASLKAGTRTTPSAAPYTPDAQSLPIRFLNAPSGYVPQREPLKLEVAVGDTSVTRVGVYANAVKVGEPCVVQDGRIALRVPMARLTARRGEPNCISFVAYTASGACVARNYALVWIDWTQQGFQFLIR